jgi:hypothetical protein
MQHLDWPLPLTPPDVGRDETLTWSAQYRMSSKQEPFAKQVGLRHVWYRCIAYNF